MKKKSSLIGRSMIFTGMTIFQKGIAFLLVPLYSHLLSPEQFGIINLVNSIAAVYILIASFALDDAMGRYYFEYRNNAEKLKKTVSTITLMSLISSTSIFLILILANKIFVAPFIGDVDYYPYMILALVPVFCTSLFSLLQKILIIEGRAMHYSINTLFFFILNTGLILIFVGILSWGAVGFLIANAIVYICYFIYSLIFLISRMSFSFDKFLFKDSLRYGLILLPNRIATWGTSGINKVIVGNTLSLSLLGILNIAITFSSLLSVFANSISLALQPWVFSKLEQGINGEKSIVKIINILAMVFCLVGFGISLFAVEIITILINERYLDAIPLIPVLILGSTASAYSVLFVHVLFYYKTYTKYIAYSTVIGAGINIILCILLIPLIGILGACIALAGSALVVCLIKMKYALKSFEEKKNWNAMFLFLIFSFIISQLCLSFNVSFGIKFGIFFSFLFIYSLILKKDLQYFKKSKYI